MNGDSKILNSKVLPNAPLVLFAKGWIDYSKKHPEMSFMEMVNEAIIECGYLDVPRKDNLLTSLFIKMVEDIFIFIDEYNNKYRFSNDHIYVPQYHKMSWLVSGASQFISYYDSQISYQEAIVRFLMSELETLSIKDFYIKMPNYSKKSKYTIINAKDGMTYSTMMNKFKRTFKHHIIDEERNLIA